MREGAVAVEREAKSGILDKSRRVDVAGIQVLRSVAKARSLDEGSQVFSISVETRAGVTRHHLDSAIDALAIVEDIQKETNLPIVITNRARGHVLTVEELRHLANLERSRAHRNYPR